MKAAKEHVAAVDLPAPFSWRERIAIALGAHVSVRVVMQTRYLPGATTIQAKLTIGSADAVQH